MLSRSILCVAGARPNFPKVAPILSAFLARGVNATWVHAGQHTSAEMSADIICDLGMPEPIRVVTASGCARGAEMLAGLARAFQDISPGLVVVVGDVDATVAGALAAKRCGIPLAHVEAGLRSGNWHMPEESNRIVVDHMADILFATEQGAVVNLRAENVRAPVHLVGNVMVDSLLTTVKHVEKRSDLPEKYALATIHRPSNVDDPIALRRILECLAAVEDAGLRVVLPLHPRTRKRLVDFNLKTEALVLPPLGYRDFVGTMKGATVVLTDSGGVQEETTALGVPCLTLREETERPITVDLGTNVVVGTAPECVRREVHCVLAGDVKRAWEIPGWDGRAAERIADHVLEWRP